MTEYWIEGITQTFEEIGIVATPKQIKYVADAVDGAHQMYGQAHGYECASPLQDENKRLKRELKTERGKTRCPDCRGAGGVMDGRVRPAWYECRTCRGEGRI